MTTSTTGQDGQISKLLQYGIDSGTASKLVEQGIGVTRLRQEPISELADRFSGVIAEADIRALKRKVKRKAIPPETLLKLLGECDHCCCICWNLNQYAPIVVHHIVRYEETQDNSYDNLVVLCPNHHAMAHYSSTLAATPLSANHLKQRKKKFVSEVGKWQRGERMYPPSGTPEPVRLSAPLLQRICNTSLENYKNERGFFLKESDWVERSGLLAVEDCTAAVQILIGEPGSGKSVYAYQLLQRHLRSGGYGLHISAQCVKDSVSLREAVAKTLHGLCPELDQGAIRDLDYVMANGEAILIVVDDINRGETWDPVALLRRLPSWARSLETDFHRSEYRDRQQSGGEQTVSYRIVCPVWPRFWNDVMRGPAPPPSWVSVLRIDRLTVTEASEVIVKASDGAVTALQAGELAVKLDCDPFLIGLTALLLLDTKPLELDGLTRGIAQQFIQATAAEVRRNASNGSRLVMDDYLRALRELVLCMLRARDLRPKWRDAVSIWFGEDEPVIEALWNLAQDQRICRLDIEDRFVFRHDRLLWAIAVECISEALSRGTDIADVVCDPYYAEAVGQALALAQPDVAILKDLRQRSPLALVGAACTLQEPTTECQRSIVAEARLWASERRHDHPELVRDAVLYRLSHTDSPMVIELTDLLRSDNLLSWRLLARLRNGCTDSGVTYCANHGLRVVWTPSPYGHHWYQIVEHAKHQHRSGLVEDLKVLCASPPVHTDQLTARQYRGAITLAGFLGCSVLTESIIAGWSKLQDRTKLLAPVIPACIRSYSEEHAALLTPLVTYWAELPDTAASDRDSVWETIIEQSAAVLSFGVDGSAITYLLEQAAHHPTLGPSVAALLFRFDRWDIIQLVSEVCASEQREDQSPRTLGERILDFWTSAHLRGQGLSGDSVYHLRKTWQDTSNSAELRLFTLSLWQVSADEAEQIDCIRDHAGDEVLADSIVEIRLRLADPDVLDEMEPFLSREPRLLRYLDRVWGDQVTSLTNQLLASVGVEIPQDYSGGREDICWDLSHVLMRAPREDAEALLTKHWTNLQYSAPFCWAGLYIGTVKTLDLIADTVDNCPDAKQFLHSILFHWRWARVPISLEELDHLLPFLVSLDDSDLRDLAKLCDSFGDSGSAWRHANLCQLDPAIREKYEPTIQELADDLTNWKSSRDALGWIDTWVSAFRRAGLAVSPLRVIEENLACNPDWRLYLLLAAYLTLFGTREDLELLDKHPVEYAHLYGLDLVSEGAKFAVRRRTLQ